MSKDAPRRSESEAVSALNEQLTGFRKEFWYFFSREAEFKMSDATINDKATDVLARYHTEVLPLVEAIPPLAELLMLKDSVGMAMRGTRMSVPSENVIRNLAEAKGIQSPLSLDLLNLFGYHFGSDTEMPRLFAQKLRQTDHYRSTTEGGLGHDLPVMLWNYV